jgi:hypothetical protein
LYRQAAPWRSLPISLRATFDSGGNLAVTLSS